MPKTPLPDGAARVISQTGRVSVMRSNGNLWAVMPDDVILPGQEIESGPDGHAILELADTSHVEVFPNSRLVFRKNHVDLRDLLDLVLGKIRVHIEKIGGQPNPYRLSSPTALIAVRGTTFDVTVDAASNTTVEVEEGLVDVSHVPPTASKMVHLSAGESFTVYAVEPLAKSHVDTIRTTVNILRQVGERTIEIMQMPRPGSAPGTTAGGGTTTPSGGGTTPSGGGGTIGGSQGGTGTPTPPSNGRGGSTSGGDTNPGTTVGPSTGTGSGSTTTPTTPTTPGTGSGAPVQGPRNVGVGAGRNSRGN